MGDVVEGGVGSPGGIEARLGAGRGQVVVVVDWELLLLRKKGLLDRV